MHADKRSHARSVPAVTPRLYVNLAAAMADRERSQSHRNTITVLYRLRSAHISVSARIASRRFDITDTARTTLRR